MERTASTGWWLAGIVLVGATLRAMMIGAYPLWGDEALSLFIARFSVSELFTAPIDPTPGLYYLFQKAWLPLGEAPWVARIPAYVFGVLTIPAAFFFGREAGGAKVGLVTAAIVAVLPPLVDYSQEARAYSLLILLETLALASLLRGFGDGERQPLGWLALAAFFAVAAIYTHVTAWLLVAPVGLLSLLEGMRRGLLKRVQTLLLLAGSAIAVVPEILRIRAYAAISQFNWLEQASPAEALELLFRFITPVPNEFRGNDGVGIVAITYQESAILSIVFLVVAFAALFLLAMKLRRLKTPQSALSTMTSSILLCLLIVFPLLLYGFGVVKPLFMPRTLLPFCLGVALGIGLLAKHARSWRFAYGAIVFIALQFLLYGTVRPKPPWDDIAVAAANAGDSPILVCADWASSPFILGYRSSVAAPRALWTTLGNRVVEIADEEMPVSFWADAFDERIWKPRVDPKRSPIKGIEAEFDEVDSIILVSFACEQPNLGKIEARFPVMKRVDYLPGRADHAPITIEQRSR